jgi:uncharacterized protein RhaS with RHS repeats
MLATLKTPPNRATRAGVRGLKNRTGVFCRRSATRAPVFGSQMPKLRRVAKLAATKSASGPSLWLSRDPLEEDGGKNLYGMVGNDPISRYDMLGLFGNLSGFGRWLANIGGGTDIPWSYFDQNNNTKAALQRIWRLAFNQTLTSRGQSASLGESELSLQGFSAPSDVHHAMSHIAWISQYKAKINRTLSVKLNKKCAPEESVFTIRVEDYAWDTSDFNPGDHFGPTMNRNGSRGSGRDRNGQSGMFHDDDFIWIRDNTPIGGDYEIWSYSEDEFEVRRVIQ